jgi:hypothetical protein
VAGSKTRFYGVLRLAAACGGGKPPHSKSNKWVVLPIPFIATVRFIAIYPLKQFAPVIHRNHRDRAASRWAKALRRKTVAFSHPSSKARTYEILTITNSLLIFLEQIYKILYIYVARFKDAIHVLYAFQKKAQKTPARNIDIARRHYKEIQGDES